jgi:hypothetical protein
MFHIHLVANAKNKNLGVIIMKKRILSILFSALCLSLAVPYANAMKLEGETINGIKAGTIKAANLDVGSIVTAFYAIKKIEIGKIKRGQGLLSGTKDYSKLKSYSVEELKVVQFLVDAFIKIKANSFENVQKILNDWVWNIMLEVGLKKLKLDRSAYEELKITFPEDIYYFEIEIKKIDEQSSQLSAAISERRAALQELKIKK